MKILYFIRNKLIPVFIQILIKKILLIGKCGKLKINIQSLYNIDIISILNNSINIHSTVSGGFNINLLGNIKIGKYSSINGPNTYLLGSKIYIIKIGKFCSIASNVTIISSNPHNPLKLTTSAQNSLSNDIGNDVIINNDVWIGNNVTILPGINIGNGVIIGAGSIVTKDIPSYAIAVGNPAKVIKYRFNKDTIIQLEKSEWWNWSLSKIKKNYNLEFIKK